MRSIAEHYADALADVAVSENTAPVVRRELADFLALLRESPDLRHHPHQPGRAAKEQTRGGASAGGTAGREPHAAEFSFCGAGPAPHGAAAGD